MKNHNYALVLIIFVACISLVVLLPKNVNADGYVDEVFEFVGSSYSSFEDAESKALKQMTEKLVQLHKECYGDLCQNDPNDIPILQRRRITTRAYVKIGENITNDELIEYIVVKGFRLRYMWHWKW